MFPYRLVAYKLHYPALNMETKVLNGMALEIILVAFPFIELTGTGNQTIQSLRKYYTKFKLYFIELSRKEQ